MASLWQPTRVQQQAQQPQQFSLQTLPQHVRLAHDHAMRLNSSSSSSSSDDDDRSDSDAESNQLDARESSALAAVLRRKAVLMPHEQNAMAMVAQRQQRRRVREPADDSGGGSVSGVAVAHSGDSQRQLQQQRSLARLHLQSLERKNSARSSASAAPEMPPQTNASAMLAELASLQQPQPQPQPQISAAMPSSPLQPAVSGAPSALAAADAAIQDEIRTVIAQTEELLSGSQRIESQLQQLQSLQPHPPLPPVVLSSSASPLQSSRLTLSEIVRRSSDGLSSEARVAPELTQTGGGDASNEREREALDGASTEEEAESMFGDDSSNEDDARHELSDGEMYQLSSLSDLQQSMQHSTLVLQQQQNQVDGDYRSVAQARDDEDAEDEELEEQTQQLSATNRDINASKARALKDSMVGNLLRLGFKENLTRMALDAGVQEIDHYDSDCELAYVDIFTSLVKMVCDAHLDSFSHRSPHTHQFGASAVWMSPAELALASPFSADSGSSHQATSLAAFKWPVFDMAQFEFGNARAGTCFDSVCVLTNLPKVSMDRTEELMEILSCNLFCMIGDPIQVVIPSVSATGRTKGHAFLEFDDHQMARACAAAIDGLTWGRGPFGRIRSSMFRQYQVKSPTAPQLRFDGGLPRGGGVLDVSTGSSTDPNESGYTDNSRFDGEAMARGGDGRTGAFSPMGGRLWMNPFAASAGSREVPFSPLFGNRSLDPFPDSPLYTSSEDGDDEQEDGGDDGDDDDGDMLWSARPVPPRSVSIDDVDVDGFDGHDVVIRRHSFADSMQSLGSREPGLFDMNDSQFSSDADDDGDEITQPDESEKPWRSYCEELIARNREMQEQVAYARRRIVQLGHNNQKLHLLIDRVERDRDGLMFENDLLQNQLNGFEDHERHHEALVTELTILRKRLRKKERSLKGAPVFANGLHSTDRRGEDEFYQEQPDSGHASASFEDVRFVLQHQLGSSALTGKSVEELKDWELLLESSLTRVRVVKEEKALALQKKLDRQVEEQQELKLCVICLSNEKSILCLPCRHLCLCEACSAREEVGKCPICRLHIDEMLLVYA